MNEKNSTTGNCKYKIRMNKSNYIANYPKEILEELVVLNEGIEAAPDKFTLSFGDRAFFRSNKNDKLTKLYLLYNLFIDQTTISNPNSLNDFNARIGIKCGVLEEDMLLEQQNPELRKKLFEKPKHCSLDFNNILSIASFRTAQEKTLYSLYKHFTSNDNSYYIYSISVWNVCERLSKILNDNSFTQCKFENVSYEEYGKSINDLKNKLTKCAYSNSSNCNHKFNASTFQHILFLLSDEGMFEFFVNSTRWNAVMCAYYRGIDQKLSKAIVHSYIKLRAFDGWQH